MFNFVKVVGGTVVQTQPNGEAGFEEAPENVVYGWLKNEDGTFSAPEINLEEYRNLSLESVDVSAEKARQQYVTSGTGQAMVYQQKVSEAEQYMSATNPVDADYALLSAESEALGKTALEVAQTIMSVRNQWLVVAGQIEKARISAKSQISNAVTVDEITQIKANIIWP